MHVFQIINTSIFLQNSGVILFLPFPYTSILIKYSQELISGMEHVLIATVNKSGHSSMIQMTMGIVNPMLQ
jgi:hypothetical protein